MLYKTYDKMTDKEKESVLKKLYVEKKESLAIIANKLSTYSNRIRRDAKKYGITLRDKSTAQKTALKSGRHKHPTKGQVRDDSTKQKIGNSVMLSWEELSDDEKLQRQETARNNWNNLSEDTKEQILKSANTAVRQTSKTGSKLEKYLLNSLLADGYKVEFHKEQMLLNTKLQIDIFLPTMNIAVEVDGPSHFAPVWGDEALKKNIKYDNKKAGLILGKGLVLIRIKQSKDFSKSRALLLYQELKDILEKIKTKFPDMDNRTILIGE